MQEQFVRAATFEYAAGMQYTVRNVPEAVDALLRRRARQERKSLNEVALEAMQRGLGLSESALKHRDLSDIAGSWKADRAADEALADQRNVIVRPRGKIEPTDEPDTWDGFWDELVPISGRVRRWKSRPAKRRRAL